MEIKRVYDFPQVGEKDMYLLHHEEIESLAKNTSRRKAHSLLYDIWSELSDSYEVP